MSITTYGWGSGATTTVGFGALDSTTQAPEPTIVSEKPVKSQTLLLQSKLGAVCKPSETIWLQKISDASLLLTSLESQLAQVASLVQQLETRNPILVATQWSLDCKIEEAAFDDKIANSDVSLDTIESKLQNSKTNLHLLESSIRTYLRKKRLGT